MKNKIHPLFEQLLGFVIHNEAPQLWDAWVKAGKPVTLSDEEEQAARRSVVAEPKFPSVWDEQGSATLGTMLAGKDARIEALLRRVEELEAKLEVAAEQEKIRAGQVGLLDHVLAKDNDGLRARVAELEKKLAKYNYRPDDSPIYTTREYSAGYNAALEEMKNRFMDDGTLSRDVRELAAGRIEYYGMKKP